MWVLWFPKKSLFQGFPLKNRGLNTNDVIFLRRGLDPPPLIMQSYFEAYPATFGTCPKERPFFSYVFPYSTHNITKKNHILQIPLSDYLLESNITIKDFCSSFHLPFRPQPSSYPPWMLIQCGLESSDQRLISLNGKTKIVAFFQWRGGVRFVWFFLDFFNFFQLFLDFFKTI